MKRIKISLLTLIFVLIGGGVFSQEIESMMKLAYPDIYGDKKIDENTVYNPDLKNFYRELYTKLQDGLNEVYLYANNGATEENIIIFTYKDLKNLSKDEKLDDLSNALIKEQRKLSKYFFGNEKYGADSVKCVRNLSLFTEYVNQNNMEEAYYSWTVLFNEFPMASKNVYIKGKDIIEPKIEAAETAENDSLKELWIDTLMLMYDQRIEFFGGEGKYGDGYVLGRKATDLLKYRTNTAYEEAYNLFFESIDLQKEDSELAVLLTAMKASYASYVYKTIECDRVVEDYIKLTEILALQSKTATAAGDTKTVENIKKAVEGVDQFFIKTGCATCEKLEEAFGPRFDENPDDIELMKKIIEILSGQKCEESALYEKVAEALYQIEPSEIAASSLAVVKFKNEKYDESIEYYDKAIEFCTEDSIKAVYNYKAGSISQLGKKYSKSIAYARETIKLNPNYGEAYILLGTSYAGIAGSCGDAFEQSTVSWVVVDKLLLAKAKDASLEEKVNGLIGSYSSRYPDKQEAFFRGINAGDSYTVSCLGETTTVRF